MSGINHQRPTFRVRAAASTETIGGEVRGGVSATPFDQVLWAREREKRIRAEQDAAIARHMAAQPKPSR